MTTDTVTIETNTAPPLAIADYARIHAVARAVLAGLGENSATKSCIFFSLIGAYLLEYHHNLSARPMAGAALYAVEVASDDSLEVLTYARFEDDGVVSDYESFHCWVECDGWAIDFMAPLFGDIMREQKRAVQAPPRMFQSPLSAMTPIGEPFAQPGDFLLLPNRPLTNDVLRRAMAKPATSDLAKVCTHWYRPTPQPMQPSLMMASDDGSMAALQLKLPSLIG